jgi:MFS family permease
VILLGWAVSTYGWRTAAFLSGVGILIIVIPLAFVLRHKPEQYGQLPDGDHVGLQDAGPFGTGIIGVEAGPTASVEQRLRATRTEWPEYDFSVRETLRTFAFWMLVLGTGARSVAMTSIVLHEVNYLTQVRDIPLVQASLALGMMVTVSIVGRFGFGWLGDYVDKRYLMITTFLLQAVGIYLLTNATTMPQVWLFVVVYGIAYGGGIPIFMAMIGEYFGRMNFATIRGFMQLFHIPTTVFGPVFAGLVYDATGSYEIAFTSFIIALVVGAAFLVLARRPLPPTRAEAIGGNSE